MFENLKDIGALMKQAQQMQQKIAEMQAELERIEVNGSAGAGLVRVTLSGKGEARQIQIDPSLLVPAERGVLEDLLVAAFNDGRSRLEATVAEHMKSMTGGLPLPPGLRL
jgi:nucleoid-associated protein EbfC